MSETGYVSRRVLWLNRLSDEVVRGISAKIRSGELAPGAELPSRQALMSDFVTSDGVIEMALGKLATAGLVARSDDGALRVAAAPATAEAFEFPEAGEATSADIVAILELRIGVESQAAALAAERRSEAQLAAIAAAMDSFADAASTGSRPGQADYAIHLAIADASGNRYIRDLTDHLGPLLIPRMRMDLSTEGQGREALEDAMREHRAILDAIAARDPDAARRAMRQHLTRSLDMVRRLG
jgi:DNA-binding FadR family transcriptional regulator